MPESENTFRTDGTIDWFPNQNPAREYLVEFFAHEFTSVCPMTGQPDFGEVTLRYVPGEKCIELRSWKYYLQGFRNRGIFYEDAMNVILDEVVAAIQPRSATVIGDMGRRGGISARVTVSFTAPSS